MSRLIFLALVFAVASAQLKCFDVPADKQANKYEGCTSSPSKTCAVDEASVPSYKDQEAFSNWSKFNWENDGYRNCKAQVHLCQEMKFAEKYDSAVSMCGPAVLNCDDDLQNVCIKKFLDNWNGYCANYQDQDGCAKESKFYKYSYYCDELNAAWKKGGKTCTDNAECELLPCYDEMCLDWCKTARTCYYKVEQKVWAAKDADCAKMYRAPWNAASTVVPSVFALVAVLLAL